MQTIEEALNKLHRSKFRSVFHLTGKEYLYLKEKGMDTIRRHAEDFVEKKLGSKDPINDGKQTPMHGHPVFKAMHATACCCRGCLYKWYRVPLHTELSFEQQKKIVELIMAWLKAEVQENRRDLKKQPEIKTLLK